MAWWHKLVAYPAKRSWVAVATRVRAPSDGGGILKLRNDVQMCGYQDVQVMWEMVRRSEMESSNKPKKRWSLWSPWSNPTSSCDPMDPSLRERECDSGFE